MRCATGLLLGICLVTEIPSAIAQCFPALPGLVSWWPGDGNANAIVSTNNGVLQGGATATATGFIGQAFNFDGTNNFVQIPDSPSLKPTNLTIECWVRFSGLDSAGSGPAAGVQYIVFKQNTRNSGFEGYDLGKVRNGGNDLFKFYLTGAGGQLVGLQGSTVISTGVWYHVAGVRGSNFAQLYVNGQLERQTNVAFPQDYGVNPLYFGTSGQGFWDRRFRGTLDEVSLYDRALSSNQIAAIYAAGAAGKCKQVLFVAQPQTQTAVIGSNVLFTVSATGLAPLSYQWRFNGANLVGETSTNLSRLNVQPAQAGNYTVVVSNSLGAVTSAVAVLTVGVPPSITLPPPNQTVDQGQTANFSVSAAGSAPLSYQWRFNGANISGATASSLAVFGAQSSDAGNYTVVVTNSFGSITSSVATLAVNTPPLLPSQSNRTVPEQTLMTVNNTATDNDFPPNTLTYTVAATNLATGLPIGNASINSSGSITWTPTEAQGPSTNRFTTIVSDGSLTATNTFLVTVTEVNTAPTLPAQSNRSVAEGTLLSVANSGSDVDLPANTLTYALAAANVATGLQIANASIDATGLITWTPTEVQGPSTNIFTTIISDGNATATNSFTVVVTEVNTPPSLSSQTNRTIAELTLLTVSNGATDADLPVNPLTYSLVVTNTGTGLQVLNATIDADGLISWTPTEAQGPSVNQFTTIVNDGNATTTNTFLVTVTEVNIPPTLSTQTNRSIAEQTLLTVNNGASDVDLPANTLIYSLAVTNVGTGSPVLNASIDANGAISWTPTEVQGPSVNIFTTIVSDGNASATNTFLVTVAEVNTAPALSVQSTRTVPELSLMTVNNAANDADIPVNTLTYSLTATNLATGLPIVNASIDSSGLISWIPTEAQGPSTNIFTTVVGDGVATTTNVFTVVVTEVNVAPVLSILSTRTIAEQTLLMVNNSANDADLPPNTLAYVLSATNLGTGLQILNANIDETGLITWTPTEAQGPSTNQFTTVVNDGLATATNSFVVIVTEINKAPSLPIQTDRVVLEQALLTVDNGATDEDLPFNALAYTLAATNLGTGLQIPNASIDANGLISWTPTEAQGPSTNSFITIVDDGFARTTNSFVVRVLELNVPPTLPAQSDRMIAEMSTLTVTNTAIDPDIPVNSLAYQLITPPAGATISAAGVITWMPTEAQAPGVYTLKTVVSDGFSNVTNSFSVIVYQVNCVYIADYNLSNAVYLALGRTEGCIAKAEMLSITNLRAAHLDITNLSGIEWASNLTSLQLSGNGISNIAPLAAMPQLVELHLDGNRISSLTPLTANTNLRVLDVGDNFLTTLSPLSGLTLLTNLAVYDNRLAGLGALQNLKQLGALTAYGNRIRNVSPLVGLTNLQRLDLRWNFITNQTLLSALTNLSTLFVGGNNFTNVNFVSPLTRLSLLNIADNSVADLSPLTSLTNLNYLTLSGNPPITNHGVISGLTGLVNLELRGNALSNVTFLSTLSKLSYVDLAYNNITSLSPFASLSNLSVVLVGNPNLDLSAGLTQPSGIWLGGSTLSNLPSLAGMNGLTAFGLEGSPVNDLSPLANLTSLTCLSLNSNQTQNFSPLAGLTNLTSLWLESASLSNSNLGFLSGLTRLRNLSLAKNRVRTLNGLEGLTNLSSVYLSYNRLTNITALTGWSQRSRVDVGGNLLDLNNSAPTKDLIQTLKWANTGVWVGCDPINQPPGFSSDIPQLAFAATAPRWFIPANLPSQLSFPVSDDLIPANELIVTADSANQTLIPTSNMLLSGSDGTRTLTVIPAPNQTGIANVTLTLTDDPGGLSTVTNIEINVLSPVSVPVPDPILSNSLCVAVGKPNGNLNSVDLLGLVSFTAPNSIISNLTGLEWATNLTYLNFSGNRISNLAPLQNLGKLASLTLFSNLVTDISPLAGLNNLGYLDVGRNPIANYNSLVSGFSGLTNLSLDGNSISNLTFLQNRLGLTALNLSYNRIQNLSALTALTNLAYLSLQHNFLTGIGPLNNLLNLDYLDLTLNLLSLTNGAPAWTVISTLTNAGALVLTDPQRLPPFIDARTNWVINANVSSVLTFSVVDGDNSGNMILSGNVANPVLVPGMSLAQINTTNWTLTLTPVPGQTSGTTTVSLAATNDVGLWTNHTMTVRLTSYLPVNNQLLNSSGLDWLTGGGAPWFGQSFITHDGISAAQSGAIGDLQESVLQTTVNGPGLLTFWWKVSSEPNFDYLDFFVNGALTTNRISGEVDWNQRSVSLPAGSHVLAWRYSRDKDTSTGYDAGWLDQVTFFSGLRLEYAGIVNNTNSLLLLYGTVGKDYEIQAVTNLPPGTNWTVIGALTATNEVMTFIDTNAISGRRFFRAREK